MNDREHDGREPWLEELDRHWRPEALDDVGRARFDARLRERMDATARPSLVRRLAPVAIALALMALAGLALRSPEVPPADETQLAAWEWELLLSDELNDEDSSTLPEEYSAIASAFLIR
ncbi:MAG: hypothetical protein JRH10_15280 [Deltaproteobacteria bacterium]|nr:hypothetical protein [Deltaproteobacteria bacterium]MBW2445155.1 hypothetical protein [Deltaproteobacteria bacterium]